MSHSIHSFILSLWLVFLAQLPAFSEAAHARKRPVVIKQRSSNKYDRQITTFDPTGRLLQVEYANESTKRGSSCAFVNYEKKCIVAVIKRREGQDSTNEMMKENSSSSTTTSTTTSTTATTVVTTASPGMTGMYRVSDGILCKMTGLDGDGRLLARHLQSAAHQLAWTEGIISSSTSLSSSSTSLCNSNNSVNVKQIANICGEVQHSLTIRNGARPLGVDVVLMGRSFSNINGQSLLGLYHCRVGGTVHECEFCASGKESDLILKELDSFMETLQSDDGNRDVDDEYEYEKDEDGNDGYVERIIQNVCKIVMNPNPMDRKIQNVDDFESERSMKNSGGSTVDVYVIRPNAKCRGGIEISCALSVDKRHIEQVSKSFV